MSHRPLRSLTTKLSMVVLLGSLTLVASAESHKLDISIANAPIVSNGTTAGAATDFVLTFADRDPAVNGLAMKEGGTVMVRLPDAFTANPGGNLILLQGWPQSPPAPPPAFPWTTAFNDHEITATMTADFDETTTFGPGFKQVHVLTPRFRNPGPGRYPVSLTIDPDGTGAVVHSGVGWVRIIPKARPAVSIVSIFSGPPGPPPPFYNPLYQSLSVGATTPDIGLYLWNRNSKPAVGVEIKMVNPGHLRLVQGKRTVGQIWIQAPPGANDFGLLPSDPSVEVDAFPFTLGVKTGLLKIQFHTDPAVAGDYIIDISMNGGNVERVLITTTN
jgi:hypothetical protein